MKLTYAILFQILGIISANQDFLPINYNISKSSYSEQNAINYAYVSSLSYCDVDSINSFNCGYVCDYLENYQVLKVWRSDVGFDSVTYVFVYDNSSKTLVISFSGTDNFDQLVQEIVQCSGVAYDLYSIGDAYVMDYFYNNYKNNIRTQFLSDFNSVWKSYEDKTSNLIFTGHSLGGAISQHAVADLLFSNSFSLKSLNLQMYTFGQPRVGDYTWSTAVQSKLSTIYRLVHDYDTVPHLPPCDPFYDLGENGSCQKSGILKWYPYHMPTEIWYKSDFSSYVSCDPVEGEDSKCSDSLLINYSIKDHLNYFNVKFGCKVSYQD